MSALFDERNDPMPNVQSMLVVTRDGALTKGLDHVETTGRPISLTAETGHLVFATVHTSSAPRNDVHIGHGRSRCGPYIQK